MFLGGLKPELSDDDIKTHFEQYGTILEFEMPFDKTKNARKGFGFITFEREETMKELIKKATLTLMIINYCRQYYWEVYLMFAPQKVTQ